MKKSGIMLLSLVGYTLLFSCTKDPVEEDKKTGFPEPPPPSDHVSLTDYTRYKNGDDWAPAFTEAFKHSDKVFVPSGTYSCKTVNVPSGKTIMGNGNGTVFTPLGTTSILFAIDGTIGDEIPIAVDIPDHSNTVTFGSAGNFVLNDDILIKSQRNCMVREGTPGIHYDVDWVLGRTVTSSCFYGEFDVVQSISGNMITTVKNRLFPSYFKDNSREPALGTAFLSRSSTTVARVKFAKNVTLKNFSTKGSANCYRHIRVRYGKDVTIEDVTFNISEQAYSGGNPSMSVISASNSVRMVARRCNSVFTSQFIAEALARDKIYANFSIMNMFLIIGCTESGFEDCTANCGTHSFGISRNTDASTGGGIPSIDCFIRRCNSSNSIWGGVSVQQACYNTELSGNTVSNSTQGIITAGRKTIITNNTVTCNMPYNTFHYYATEARGGSTGIALNEGYSCDTEIRGNHITGYFTGIILLDGYEEKNNFEEGNIIVEGNTVVDCIRGFGVYKNSYNLTNNGRKDLNIVIRNNSFTRTGGLTATAGSSTWDTAGIRLPKSTAGVKVDNNTFKSFYHGVWMADVDYVSVKNNNFTTGTYGLFLSTSPAPSGTIHFSHSGNTYSEVTTQTSGLDQSYVEFY